MKMSSLQLCCFLLISLILLMYVFSDPVYYESIEEMYEGSWRWREKEEYFGEWRGGFLVNKKARNYAIVDKLENPVFLKDGTVVLEFEVCLQSGLRCGDAYYINSLRQQETWGFDEERPSLFMIGPDKGGATEKRGATNKVHFFINHQNPKSGEQVEHHLKFPLFVSSHKWTHVFTILKPDNKVQIFVDREEKKNTNFLSSGDSEPALIPDKTIPDPEDKKPEDWDERAQIPDPEAKKPEDWDEDAPMEILDEEAEKPEGWLEDEPEEVDDPEAVKPKDWDDEEDGEWEAPKIDNPKCESAPGCGERRRPNKRNPAYKGKWHAPLIENPAYKGIWKPQEIPNPDYFEPISATRIEIWTRHAKLDRRDGCECPNLDKLHIKVFEIRVRHEFTIKTKKNKKKVKPKIKEENQKAEEQAAGFDGLKRIQKAVFDVLYKIADLIFSGVPKIKGLIERA